MAMTTLGDLSHSYAMRLRNVALRQDIDRLTTELATGQVANIRKVLAGNHSYLTDIERRETVLGGYKVATAEAAHYAGAMQESLELFQTFGANLSANLLTAGTSASAVSGTDTVADARHALDGMIKAINTNSAGRFLFSGAAVDRPPLPDTETLLSALRTAVSGATTPDDMLSQAATWFADPAGFETQIYRGASVALTSFDLSQADRLTLDLRAMDPKLLATLSAAAVAALAEEPGLGFDIAEQSELFAKTGQAMLAAHGGIIALQAEVGAVQARIEQASARNSAEQTSLEFAKAALLQVDPFEAATRLEEAQFQLQSLYSVTVRMSQLSLVNFL